MNETRRKIAELANSLYYLADQLLAEPSKKNADQVANDIENALDKYAEPTKQTTFEFEDFSYNKERYLAK